MSFSVSGLVVTGFARTGQWWGLEEMLNKDESGVAEVYPWVTDLKEAGIPRSSIAKAIIETENVTWEHTIPQSSSEMYVWRGSPEHQEVCQSLDHTGDSCPHRIIQRMGDLRYDVPLDRVGSDRNSFASRLEKLAQWEEVVFKHCGVGGVLHPDVQSGGRYGRMDPDGDTVSVIYTPLSLDADTTIYSWSNPPEGSAVISRTPVFLFVKLFQRYWSMAPWWVLNLPRKTWLTLIRPLSPSNRIDLHKHTMPTAQMTRDTSNGISNSALPDTLQSPLKLETWNRGLLRYCVSALRAILVAMTDLNKLGGCCDSFPVFTRSKFYCRLSAVDVRFEDISICAQMLSQPLSLNEPESALRDEKWRSEICDWTLNMFEKLFEGKEDAVMFLQQCTKVNGIATFVLHMTALCAQMFSIGLVTFCGGHCSDFYMTRISRTIERFQLRGIVSTGPGIIVEKLGLSCLGDMVQKPVWAFKFDQTPGWTTGMRDIVNYGRISRDRHDIEAKISQLLDIWDTTIINDEERAPGRVKLRMGNGFLSRAKRPFFSLVWPGTMLHWSSKDDGVGLPKAYLEDDAKVIVGAITVNPDCLLSRQDCENALAGSLIDLGSQPGQWRQHTRTTGVVAGLAGGAMAPATMAFNHSITQLWCPPVFKKGSAMQQWNENPSPPLTILNEPWGLEFSLCTGVARRVPLRALLDTTVITYLQCRIPNLSLNTDVIERIRQASSDEAATKIYNDVAKTDEEQFKALQLAVKHLVGALQWSRLDATKKNLLLWWPEPFRATDRGIKLDESWYNKGSWIRILEDTETCAMFGLATSRCLEDSRTGRTCRNPSGLTASRVLSKKTEFILYTGIGPYEKQRALPVGEYLMIESKRAEIPVFKVQQPATFEHDAYILEYQGAWPRPAVWVKNVTLKVVESAELIELGKEVVMCHRRPA
ncbi:hypothetical protein LTR70_003486 [Exophiala xenobiotica]|uniref:Heterokaryon incompatibility domain-containing protein n=1 Tax=Lithohypha guttulata TaxID=1690604 RepID=A0ABR0KG73_9EURO|nr:hypothetical protein LTR24_003034 [Lithohypha guttulata]KAK5323024.1 hypothetical protein LTR70_003486 [Exophiala xenobiotica]